jgi:hypothetical protein
VKLETAQSIIALTCVVSISAFDLGLGILASAGRAGAAPLSIGTAIARGSFRVDDATVTGNATLFEGTTVETHSASSFLDLAAGPRLTLAADSRGRIFGDRLLLERGSEMQNAPGFRIEARGLIVRPDTAHTSGRVLLEGGERVQVAALTGSLRVLNSGGLLVATVDPGVALAFQASAEPEKLTGCLRAVPGHYILTDEVTNVTVELSGPGLDRESGNRVEVTGAMDPTAAPVSGTTQYIRISQLKRMGKGCLGNKAAAAGAGGAAGKAAGAGGGGVAGLSIGATAAVIGGVAAAAVVGGLAASGSFSGSSGSTVSR